MIAKLIGDRVLVALPPKDETTATHQLKYEADFTYRQEQVTESGLIVAAQVESYSPESATRGIVVQLGEKKGTVDLDDVIDILESPPADEYDATDALMTVTAMVRALKPAPFDVAVGDCVIFAPSAGEQFEQDDIQYVILREADVLGVLDATKAA
jgi:co-chaperonin GroES (HSP10)